MPYIRSSALAHHIQEWQAAIAKFSEVLSLNDYEKSAKLYIERCAHFIANPPGADLSGVWVMDSK